MHLGDYPRLENTDLGFVHPFMTKNATKRQIHSKFTKFGRLFIIVSLVVIVLANFNLGKIAYLILPSYFSAIMWTMLPIVGSIIVMV